MSLLSIFIKGDSSLISNHLENNDFRSLEDASRFRVEDFSGGMLYPNGGMTVFLFVEDFDILIKILSDKKLIDYSTFREINEQLIWGEDSEDAESQAFLIKEDFIDIYSKTPDSILHEFSDSWNRQKKEDFAKSRAWAKRVNLEEKIKCELAFFAIPLATTVGLVGGDFNIWVKALVPALIMATFLTARFFVLGGFHFIPKKSKDEYVSFDWSEKLISLRDLFVDARKNNERVVYYWSL